MAEVFISYSRKDRALVTAIHDALKGVGRDTWVDWEGIPPTSEWLAEIRAAIESCDNFLFVLSPESAASDTCRLELEHAIQHRKRLIPIVARSVSPDRVPPSIASLNWIFFDADKQFDASFTLLIAALDTDFDWVRSHTRLLVRARQWESKSRDAAVLLRGSDLREAESWLATAAVKNESLPTALHAEYIVASRRNASRRLRYVVSGVSVALIVSIALAIVAFLQSRLAEDRRLQADQSAALAEQSAGLAEKSAAAARASAATAEDRRQEAVRNAELAEQRRQEADERYRQALGRRLAIQSETIRAEHPDRGPLSALLAIEAVRNLQSVETEQALRGSLALLPRMHWKAPHPSQRVVGLHFSPDGKRVVTTDAIWEAASGRQVTAFDHEGRSTTFAVSADGERMARAGGTAQVRVWNARTGEALTRPLDDVGRISRLALSPDGSLVAADGQDNTARIWSVATGRLIQTLQPADETLSGPVSDVAFSADGRYFAASRRSEVKVWDVATWQVVASMTAGTAPVMSFGFSPDASAIVTASIGQARIFDFSGKPPGELAFDGTLGSGARVAFSPDGRYVAASGDTSVVWDVTGVAATRRPVMSAGPSDALVFSADSTRVAIAARDNTARIIELPDGRELARMSHAGTVSAVAFSPDGASLATAGDDGELRLWTATAASGVTSVEGEFVRFVGPYGLSDVGRSAMHLWDVRGNVRTRIPADGEAGAFTVAADGTRVAAASGDTATVWQLPGGNPIAEFHHSGAIDWKAVRQREEGERRRSSRVVSSDIERMEKSGSVRILALSSNGRYVLTGRADEIARLWDVENRRLPVKEIPYRERIVAAFSRDGRWLTTWSPGEPVRVWDLRTSLSAQLVAAHDIDTLVVSRSGRHVVMAGPRDVTLWRVAPASRLATIGDVRETVVSPDGAFLLTNEVNQARLWDLETGRPVTTVTCTCTISDMYFSPGGGEFAIVADDGVTRIRKPGVREFALDLDVAGRLTSVSFSADGARFAGIESRLTLRETEENVGQPRPTGRELTLVRVWDLRNRRELFSAEAEGPTAFSADGRLVAAGRRVWEAATGREVTRVASPIVAFSPDSSHLITREADRTAMWVWRPADLISVACDTIRGTALIDDWGTFVRDLPYPGGCAR
jgi:WD40 repeat protein